MMVLLTPAFGFQSLNGLGLHKLKVTVVSKEGLFAKAD